MGQLLDHDQKFSTISEEIGARAPLIIELTDDSKFLVKIDYFIIMLLFYRQETTEFIHVSTK